MARGLPAPGWIAHADWGSAPRKRVAVAARRQDGGYVVHRPHVVGRDGPLVQCLGIDLARGETALLGFDFPIGVPRRYAALAGIASFGRWLREVDLSAPFFSVAATLDEVSVGRPFFPARIATRSPGIKRAFHERLGLSAAEALRLCDRAHTGRRAASELFWTLGPRAAGKAALSGWRDALRPALDAAGSAHRLWPFDGALDDLLSDPGGVIVEAYPAEAYGRLGLQMGRPGTAKTRQESRRGERGRLRAWCIEHDVRLDPVLDAAIDDGFGPGPGGEDAFDATVGLLAMIDTLANPPEPLHPVDPAVRDIEGWIFGQHPPAAAAR